MCICGNDLHIIDGESRWPVTCVPGHAFDVRLWRGGRRLLKATKMERRNNSWEQGLPIDPNLLVIAILVATRS